MPAKSKKKLETKKPEMMHPRCRGCGHNFFKLPQITVAENDENPRFCEYCRAEGVHDMATMAERDQRVAWRPDED